MAKYSIEDTTLTALADAIREKSGTTEKLSVDAMTNAVANIETGNEATLETCTVSLDIPSAIDCDHEVCYTKVVDGDTVLVNETLRASDSVDVTDILIGSIMHIRADGGFNGYHVTPNIDDASAVEVLENIVDADGWWCLTILVNGDCTIDEGEATSASVTITENGTHDVTDYATAIVNVPSSGATFETCNLTINFDAGLAGNYFRIYATRFVDGKITQYDSGEIDDAYTLGSLTIDNTLCDTAITFLSDVCDAVSVDEGEFTIDCNEYASNVGCSILRLIAPSSPCTDTVTLDY